MIIKYYTFFIIVFSFLKVSSQTTYNFNEIKIDGEEPINNLKVAVDKYNRIWVGNFYGLYLYNGETYKIIKDNSNGKLSFNPMFIKINKRDEIIYGTYFGLNKLENGELIQYKSKLIKDLSFIDMLEVDSSSMLFATSNGIYKYKDNVFQCQIKGKIFNSFLKTRQGIFALSDDGVYKNEKDTWINYVKYNFKFSNLYRTIFEINNVIYFGEDTILKIENNSFKSTNFIFPGLIKDSKIHKRKLYFSSGSIIYQFDGTKLIEIYENEGTQIADYCFDLYENIVIADNYNLKYFEYNKLRIKSNEFNAFVLYTISQNKKIILNGTSLYLEIDNKKITINYDKNVFNNLKNMIVYDVKFDSIYNKYYVFSEKGLLLISNNTLKHFNENTKLLKEDYYRCLDVFFFKNERYLIFENRIVKGYKKLVTIYDTTQKKLMLNSFERCLYNEKLFFGGSRGFGYFDFKTNKIIDLSNNLIKIINEEYYNLENISTSEEVLFIKIRNKNLLAVFYSGEFLNFKVLDKNNFNKLYIDKKNDLWLLNKHNLLCYKIIKNKNSIDLIEKYEIHANNNLISILKFPISYRISQEDTNALLIITSDKIISVELTSQFTKNKISPIVFFKDFFLNNEELTLNINLKNSGLIIRNGFYHNMIEFGIGSVYLQNINDVAYRYKIIGLDDEWKYIKGRSNIIIQSLKSGDYNLIIQASFDGYYWGNKFELKLKIIPPWYLSIFIKIAISLIVIAFLLVLFKLYYKIRKRRALLLQKITISELKALRAQINPHYLSNSMVGLQSMILDKKYDLAVEAVSQYSKVMRSILNNSEVQFLPLAKEKQTLEEYMELEGLMNFDTYQFTVSCTNISKYEQHKIQLPSMLVQPFIENAIIHGLKPKIENLKIIAVEFSLTSDYVLQCSITDNGVGRHFNPQTNRKSMGNKNVEDRLELYGKLLGMKTQIEIIDLLDGSNKPIGTKVVLILPYKKTV